jgi:hypothetical protein
MKTKFFYANASIKHMRNFITSLQDSSGSVFFNHEQKATLIWEDFRERLDTSAFETMQFDLDDLLHNEVDLSPLEMSFSIPEIDNVVKNLPIDKSPGLDEFNNEFIKRCCSIIKQDFYNLCFAFHSGEVCLQSINGSFITLIPKVDDPLRINDFRPISLLNCCVKFITKLLANRL